MTTTEVPVRKVWDVRTVPDNLPEVPQMQVRPFISYWTRMRLWATAAQKTLHHDPVGQAVLVSVLGWGRWDLQVIHVKITRVAESIGVPPTAVEATLDRLVAAGLLVEQARPQWGRSFQIVVPDPPEPK